jgi:deoxyribonuclease V
VDDEVFLFNEGEVVGAVVPTRNRAKPVYVSIGHMISLKAAVKIVQHCIREARVPEPIRVASLLRGSGKSKLPFDKYR